ncbi:MAG: hypothetical protein QGI21_06795 [Candidatus Poseidoniaceae archaeon]|jgi:hypothetical protein|nr:hypothetical protein [Candidatus Poseidoniaceae archaeon]
MESELQTALLSVKGNLAHSKDGYKSLSEFCSVLNQNVFLLETIFQDPLPSIAKMMVDNWLCEIEFQIEKNQEYNSLNNKLQIMIENKIPIHQINQSFAPISSLHASISDSKGRDQSGRPICGILPKPFTKKLNDLILEIVIDTELNQPKNWNDWAFRLSKFLNVIEEVIRFFPPSHHFASLPCSIAILIRNIRFLAIEQHQLSKTLEILTAEDDRGANFHLDVLMLKRKLLPIPLLATGDDE